MAIGKGVSPESLGLVDKEAPKDKEAENADVSEVDPNPNLDTPQVSSTDFVWQKSATHAENFRNPRYWRVAKRHVRVFDMSVKEDREFYEDLQEREAGIEVERNLEKYNIRFMDTRGPLAFPPDAGKTNLRIYREWGDLEFVRLDKTTGLPQARAHE